jgi:hypothetical protein
MDQNKRIKEVLDEYRLKYELYDHIECTKEENEEYKSLSEQGKSLPEDIYPIDSYWTLLKSGANSEFLRLLRHDLTEAEIMELLMYKKLDMLRTIRNCVVFFTALTVISLILFFLGVIL